MINPSTKQIARFEKDFSNELETQVSNFNEFSDGFSFIVATELGAYKAAYKYQYSNETAIKEATPTNGWLVQVYHKE